MFNEKAGSGGIRCGNPHRSQRITHSPFNVPCLVLVLGILFETSQKLRHQNTSFIDTLPYTKSTESNTMWNCAGGAMNTTKDSGLRPCRIPHHSSFSPTTRPGNPGSWTEWNSTPTPTHDDPPGRTVRDPARAQLTATAWGCGLSSVGQAKPDQEPVGRSSGAMQNPPPAETPAA